jgi:mycothione reductase
VTHYDLALIGTGSGNTIVTKQFSGWRVAIIEESTFGGTCLNVGCIPTKMFVFPADIARTAQDGPDLGVDTSYAGGRWPEIRDRIFGRIDPISASGRAYRQRLPNIDLYEGHAAFVDDHTVTVSSSEAGTEAQITADQIVIAAGSRSTVPEIAGLDEVEYHTSDTVMRLEELPERMVIVGGGYVAAEFAHVFSALGTRVTQVHRGPVLLREHDEAVSHQFTELAGRQWDVLLNTNLSQVARRGDATVVTFYDGSELETDVLLMATGRVSNADRLGLENTSIVMEDRRVRVDEYQRTGVEGIWALGDASNDYQLKHVANLEADTVRHNLLHPDDLVACNHRYVPSVVFTHPQIASVGLTSQDARAKWVDHVTGIHDYADIAYGWAMESPPGEHFVKLLATRDREELLGAHIIGPQASLLLQPLVQAMSLGTSPREMARGQYWPHPSMAEVVENALLEFIT